MISIAASNQEPIDAARSFNKAVYAAAPVALNDSEPAALNEAEFSSGAWNEASESGSLDEENEAARTNNSILKHTSHYGHKKKKETDNKKKKKREKKIRFSTIEMHCHPIELGDNPSVTDGAPLTIGWQAFETITIPVDEYEKSNPSRNRRPEHELVLSSKVRSNRLKKEGYSRHDLNKSISNLKKMRTPSGRSLRMPKLFSMLRGDSSRHSESVSCK
jgi:hypothetical protein